MAKSRTPSESSKLFADVAKELAELDELRESVQKLEAQKREAESLAKTLQLSMTTDQKRMAVLWGTAIKKLSETAMMFRKGAGKKESDAFADSIDQTMQDIAALSLSADPQLESAAA